MPGPADTAIGYGENWANVSNTPFRMYKHYVHEGGISTPLIAHWPNIIKARGELRHTPGHMIDIMATCVDIAGAFYPKQYKGENITPMEGKSLVPVFNNQALDRDLLFWEHEGNRAIRVGDWKIVAKGRHGQDDVKWELYNLVDDRSELNNLASSQPQRLKTMIELWISHAKRKVIPWPIKKREITISKSRSNKGMNETVLTCGYSGQSQTIDSLNLCVS